MLVSCAEPQQSFAKCEGNEAAYYRGDGGELSRFACASDEQCVQLSPKQAVCRLMESCTRIMKECRGDALVRCNPQETFLERVDCVTTNHGKPVPGRCVSDTRGGPDCVDADAGRCTTDAFPDTCEGTARKTCWSGYTSVEQACPEASLSEGGTCRLNAGGRGVCAQPDAGVCDPPYVSPRCEGAAVVRCENGFVWTHACGADQTCGQRITGDVIDLACR